MRYTDKYTVLKLGQGWSWSPIEDLYWLNNKEFVITGDFIREEMKNWDRKMEKVHIIDVLCRLYRESL